MRKTFTYKNKRTNETTESKEQAKIWYEAGTNTVSAVTL